MTIIAPPPLDPQVATASPLTPRGRTAVRVTLVIAAAVLVVGCAISLGVTAWGLSAVRVVADEKGLPKDMRYLIIDTGDVPAAVRLTTDRDAGEPRVSMRIINAPNAGDQTLVVTQEAGGTRLTVNGEGSRFMDWGRGGEITVTLPPELARALTVTVQQGDGVLLAQADLYRLVVRNTDGAVVLGGATRNIDVRTRDGNVVAREPISVRNPSTPKRSTATSPSSSRARHPAPSTSPPSMATSRSHCPSRDPTWSGRRQAPCTFGCRRRTTRPAPPRR